MREDRHKQQEYGWGTKRSFFVNSFSSLNALMLGEERIKEINGLSADNINEILISKP